MRHIIIWIESIAVEYESEYMDRKAFRTRRAINSVDTFVVCLSNVAIPAVVHVSVSYPLAFPPQANESLCNLYTTI